MAAFLAAGFLVVAAFLAADSFGASSFSSDTSTSATSSDASFEDLSSGFGVALAATFNENTFGPLSPSSFCTKPCFLAESWPSKIASLKRSSTNLIVLDESSLIGIKFDKFVGLLFVSTNPKTGIPIFKASCTAIFSFSTSITNRASGRPFMSLTPSKLSESFFISFSSITASFFIIPSNCPEDLFSSYSRSLLIGIFIVFQFVSMPPNHLCDM